MVTESKEETSEAESCSHKSKTVYLNNLKIYDKVLGDINASGRGSNQNYNYCITFI